MQIFVCSQSLCEDTGLCNVEHFIVGTEQALMVGMHAGSQYGDSLTVMSKGTRFTQQSYKVSDIFPFEWIKKKWREGFHISAMATGGHPSRQPAVSPQPAVCPWQWAIVMSRTTGWADQVRALLGMPVRMRMTISAETHCTCVPLTIDYHGFVLMTKLQAPAVYTWRRSIVISRTTG